MKILIDLDTYFNPSIESISHLIKQKSGHVKTIGTTVRAKTNINLITKCSMQFSSAIQNKVLM